MTFSRLMDDGGFSVFIVRARTFDFEKNRGCRTRLDWERGGFWLDRPYTRFSDYKIFGLGTHGVENSSLSQQWGPCDSQCSTF